MRNVNIMWCMICLHEILSENEYDDKLNAHRNSVVSLFLSTISIHSLIVGINDGTYEIVRKHFSLLTAFINKQNHLIYESKKKYQSETLWMWVVNGKDHIATWQKRFILNISIK